MYGRPKLLDLFSCAGGAAMGYHRAGFEVVGVDISPQPRYPFEHHVGDALEYLAAHGHEFDAVHASPPCQTHTAYGRSDTVGWVERYQDFLPQTRAALIELGKPYVIENVVGAPMDAPFQLCGSSFGLDVRRHRLSSPT
jgi:DNA (cytosine-5)-methyltransferase 1